MKNLMSEQRGGVEPLLLSDTSDSNESPERLPSGVLPFMHFVRKG